MPKRPADRSYDVGNKRQRTEPAADGALDTITSSRQLQKCLAFHQDAAPEIRKGLRSFKVFLESILYAEDRDAISGQHAILKEFLHSQTPQEPATDESTAYPDLLQAWGFAAQTNNDGLLSAVPAIFALLLRTISVILEFREQGLSLCKTVLQPAQLKLISKGLSAPKHKEHVISPCLRLLTEIVSFDGGALAQRVYAARQYTFDPKVLPRSLSSYAVSDDSDKARSRPSLRSNAVRYVLANFKFQKSAAKAELLKNGSIIRAMFDHVKHDSIEILKGIFDTFRTHVFADINISGSIKGHILNANSLGHIVTIWRHDESTDRQELDDTADALVRDFLHFVCTDASAGLARVSGGWYPVGAHMPDAAVESSDGPSEIDLGLNSIEWYNSFHTHVPIRSTTLSIFAQNLRPYAALNEAELLLAILEASPELVADYFVKKTGFAFDPKLTSTWMGYSAFLFSTIQLDLPHFFGNRSGYARVPPPVSIAMENILPEPLSHKVLTKCLNQQHPLITFFAVRLMVAAFTKLQKCLEMFKEAARDQGNLWTEASTRLLSEFSLRCPKMKDVIATYRKTAADNQIQREILLRLLKLYYQVTPQIAFEEKFDVAIPLSTALARVEDSDHTSDGAPTLDLLELNHLLQIALWSPDMKWWQKPAALKFSPFVTLLRVVTRRSGKQVVSEMVAIIQSVVAEAGLLQSITAVPAVDVLVRSLGASYDAGDILYEYLDDVCGRAIRQPIKYEDNLSQLSVKDKTGPVSLLWMAMAEQWPFIIAKPGAQDIAHWISLFRSGCEAIGEDSRVLGALTKTMKQAAEQPAVRQAFKPTKLLNMPQPATPSKPTSVDQPNEAGRPYADLTTLIPALIPPAEPSKHPGLHRWSTPSSKDIREAVEDGSLAELMLCLSSAHTEVRALALRNLTIAMTRLAAAKETYSDAPQLYLLTGELVATATPLIPTTPLPHLVTAYAAAATPVLTDALHPLYEPLCRFHTRGPSWNPSRLASQLIHRVLFSPPAATLAPTTTSATAPDTTNAPSPRTVPTDLAWLLSYLLSGLRTPADLDLLRARGAFEPLLALALRTDAGPGLRGRVLALVWRAVSVEGGSTTLVTRAGVVAWLAGLIADAGRDGDDDEVARLLLRVGEADAVGESAGMGEAGFRLLATRWGMISLVKRLWETCDRERVDAWSASTMEQVVQGITGPLGTEHA